MLARLTQHIAAMLVEPIRPFDWWMLGIEVAVLILIAIEVRVFAAPEWIHKRKAKKHLKAISPLLEDGHQLLASFPMAWNLPTEETFAWIERVKTWGRHTEERLATLSLLAAMIFSFTSNAGMSGRSVVGKDGRTIHLSGATGDAYQIFQSKLRNLQQIMAKPEVYL
jgi:hypothetical protein